MRSGLVPSVRPVVRTHPTSCPVSSANWGYSWAEYLLIWVMLLLARNCPIMPAACQVVPPLSRPCSNSTTSFQPALAKW